METPTIQERFLEPEEVAQKLRVKPSTVYTWIRNRQLRAIKVGVKCIRVPVSAYLDFLKAGQLD